MSKNAATRLSGRTLSGPVVVVGTSVRIEDHSLAVNERILFSAFYVPIIRLESKDWGFSLSSPLNAAPSIYICVV